MYIHNIPPPLFWCTFIGHSLTSGAKPSQTQVMSILSLKCEHWPQTHALYFHRFELTTELGNLNIVATGSHDSYLWLWLTRPTKNLQLTNLQFPVLQSYKYMWFIQFIHNIQKRVLLSFSSYKLENIKRFSWMQEILIFCNLNFNHKVLPHYTYAICI